MLCRALDWEKDRENEINLYLWITVDIFRQIMETNNYKFTKTNEIFINKSVK
jgi:hypothetical protein